MKLYEEFLQDVKKNDWVNVAFTNNEMTGMKITGVVTHINKSYDCFKIDWQGVEMTIPFKNITGYMIL